MPPATASAFGTTPHGLPLANRRVELVCRVIAVLASVWFALAAGWEIAGAFGPGHLAASASVGVGAENMLHWHILGPVIEYTLQKPLPAQYYANHPWGIYWTTAPFTLLGHHDWVCRIAPVLLSAATPPLLYAIGRAIWGPVAGAVAACSMVVLPIALAFANLNAFEVPVIFGTLLCTWGYVRFSQTWRRRWMLVSLLGLLHALNADWSAYFFTATVLGVMLPRGLFLKRWFGPVDTRRFTQWWIASVALAGAVLIFTLYNIHEAGQLPHLLKQGEMRSAGMEQPLEDVLEARKYWIEVSFTPLAILVGKLAVPLLVLRIVLLRRALEVFPLAILVMATLQYVIFKQGADVHIFWPHLFAPYFALAMAAVAASLEGIGRFVAQRLGRPGLWVPSLIALAISLLVPAAIAHDGLTALYYSRLTGGRFDEKGRLIHPDKDKVAFVGWVSKQMESRTGARLHPGMKQSLWVDWELQRPVSTSSIVPSGRAQGSQQYYLLDSRFTEPSDLEALANRYAVRAVGPFWMIDRDMAAGPLSGHAFQRRAPLGLERYLVSGVFPIYEGVEDDPFVTWELRDHFAQTPNPAPKAQPKTFEQKRIAHNVAISQGDTARATRLLRELSKRTGDGPKVSYKNGGRLLGAALENTPLPELTVYFLSAGPTDEKARFVIRSEVEQQLGFSLVPADDKPREVGMPFAIPTTHWKKGYVYSTISQILERPGTERFYGYWQSRYKTPGYVPKSGPSRVTLLTY